MGRKFRLSVHRKNEERRKAVSMRLAISIPLETVVLHTCTSPGAKDGMFLKSLLCMFYSTWSHLSQRNVMNWLCQYLLEYAVSLHSEDMEWYLRVCLYYILYIKMACALTIYCVCTCLIVSRLLIFTEDCSKLTVSVPLSVYRNSSFHSLTIFQARLESLGVLPQGMFLH